MGPPQAPPAASDAEPSLAAGLRACKLAGGGAVGRSRRLPMARAATVARGTWARLPTVAGAAPAFGRGPSPVSRFSRRKENPAGHHERARGVYTRCRTPRCVSLRSRPFTGSSGRLLSSAPMVPDPVDPASLRRALVVKLRHHGDVLLAAPGVLGAQNHAPQLEIDALVYDDTRRCSRCIPRSPRCTRWGAHGAGSRCRRKLGWSGGCSRGCARAGTTCSSRLPSIRAGASLARLLGPRYSVAPEKPIQGSNVAAELHASLPAAG